MIEVNKQGTSILNMRYDLLKMKLESIDFSNAVLLLESIYKGDISDDLPLIFIKNKIEYLWLKFNKPKSKINEPIFERLNSLKEYFRNYKFKRKAKMKTKDLNIKKFDYKKLKKYPYGSLKYVNLINNLKVVMLDDNDHIIKQFENVNNACKYILENIKTKMRFQDIKACINRLSRKYPGSYGRNTTHAFGYKWCWLDKYNDLKGENK